MGNIQVGQGSSIWPGAVLRADHGRIAVGRGTAIQDRVVVHSGGGVENEGQIDFGDGTVISHSAVVHCRKIGSHVLIGNNATVLDGAVVGDWSIVAPGTVVLPRTHTPPHSYVAGLPAQVLRPLTPEEEALIERVAKEASALASLYRDGKLDSNPEEKNMIRSFRGKSPKVHPRAYVNEAAYLVGDVELGELTSLWPGATVRGDVAKVTVGKNTSLQDNVVVHAHEALTIGDNNTVGHAVVIHARRIGSNNLLGMNCTLEERVEVGDNCVIAAGAVVPAGMIVPSESFVAGNPAQVLWRVEP
ncbi:MAG: hypothetical protein HY685_04955, partial [Chloroflexi bacterium]|nr:hypothetical protein [Chloroflexota bacterium]